MSPLAAPMDAPDPAQVTIARGIVASMANSDRGPYSQIRWFCNDGSVVPPKSFACRERGGGRQHAQYSAARAQLVELGYSVGTIYAALSFDEFFDADQRNQRLRELPLEAYLTDIDDGWVLRRAAHYRGRIQAEDEEAAGQTLLVKLLADSEWLKQNFLLAREVVRTVPHGVAGAEGREVRRAIQSLAEVHPTAQPLRIEIHNAPTRKTAAKVRQWAATQKADEVAEAARTIAASLDAMFDPKLRRTRIQRMLAAIRATPAGAALVQALIKTNDLTDLSGATLANLRNKLAGATQPKTTLQLMDLLNELEAELLSRQMVSSLSAGVSRAARVAEVLDLLDAAFGVGLLSEGEHRALRDAAPFRSADVAEFNEYRDFVRLLQRVPQWAVGSMRFTFAEPLTRYTALDSRAARFVDDTLRSSPLLPLATISQTLSADLQRLSGLGTELFGQATEGIVGLNPGFALGNLRIIRSAEELATASRNDIVVLEETTAELPPVGGIMTLGEGNPLSHIQLLARNFGIPNVAISSDGEKLLAAHEGEEVLLIVGVNGSVAVLDRDAAQARLGEFMPGTANAHQSSQRLRVPAPDLTVTSLLPIDQLHKGLSGKVVGPKAANLGELNRLFPGKVAPAIAIPFGVFAQHTAVGPGNVRSQLQEAYEQFRNGEINEATLNESLANIRRQISGVRFELGDAFAELSNKLFGSDGTGAFIRSDTNVEDLPEFTGAGLSETLPNVTGVQAQINAIPSVWASVLSPRAIAWRSNLLDNPADVYASVLVMQSVDSTKSGVLITSNLVEPATPGLTVSTAWGVGGAVAGEAASTVVLLADGGTRLVSEAKTAYQRKLASTGGVNWLAANDGAVLTVAEQQQLRELAAEVADKYTPVFDADGHPRPWDIEFGFVDGQLALFQIRPLVEKGQARISVLSRRLFRNDVSPPDVVRGGQSLNGATF